MNMNELMLYKQYMPYKLMLYIQYMPYKLMLGINSIKRFIQTYTNKTIACNPNKHNALKTPK